MYVNCFCVLDKDIALFIVLWFALYQLRSVIFINSFIYFEATANFSLFCVSLVTYMLFGMLVFLHLYYVLQLSTPLTIYFHIYHYRKF